MQLHMQTNDNQYASHTKTGEPAQVNLPTPATFNNVGVGQVMSAQTYAACCARERCSPVLLSLPFLANHGLEAVL